MFLCLSLCVIMCVCASVYVSEYFCLSLCFLFLYKSVFQGKCVMCVIMLFIIFNPVLVNVPACVNIGVCLLQYQFCK